MTREDELLKKIKKGDAGCWDELIDMYYSELLRYCLFHTPDRTTAEDAVQETFLKVVRYFPRYKNRGKFRAFLYKVASNTCIDMCRKKKEELLPDDLIFTEKGYEQSEADADFLCVTESLPVEQREVVLLRFAQELSIREIAEITDIPMRTVQSRLRAALKRLEKSMREEGAGRE